jgi:hypothetical protein
MQREKTDTWRETVAAILLYGAVWGYALQALWALTELWFDNQSGHSKALTLVHVLGDLICALALISPTYLMVGVVFGAVHVLIVRRARRGGVVPNVFAVTFALLGQVACIWSLFSVRSAGFLPAAEVVLSALLAGAATAAYWRRSAMGTSARAFSGIRLFVGTTAAVVLLTFLTAMLLGQSLAAFTSRCISGGQMSPDRAYVAVIIDHDTGAVGSWTEVQIRPGFPFPPMFHETAASVRFSDRPSLTWLDNRTLVVRGSILAKGSPLPGVTVRCVDTGRVP